MSKKAKFFAVSNAHLDTQWNWTIVDTIRDCIKNTMDYNFPLFRKYPFYEFNFEGAFRYKLMQEYYPAKYKQVKKYVKEGRWHPVGAAWDAMDVNVPSGEALMRQILIGNNWFEQEFGVISKDIFLPDCFGFRASLPSIEAHMGLMGFSTQKLAWGAGAPLLAPDGRVLPPVPNSELPRLDLGRWIGPDGKGVFVSLQGGNYTYNFDNHNDERPIQTRREIAEAIAHNEKYSGVARRMMYYGTGDYGGAPSDGSARLLQAAADSAGDFDVIAATPTDVYEGLTEEEIAGLPVYQGALLIPHGYGAMTSHTAMKRLNRRNERLADRTERAASAAKYLAGEAYPKKRLNEGWKTFLWHQFHDDLTGTSIASAYRYSHNDELLAANIFAGELQNALSVVERKLDTRGKGQPYVVYNPSAFSRCETVRLPYDGKNGCVYLEGKRLPTAGEKGCVIFRTPLAPASFTVVHVREERHRAASSLKVGSSILENDFLRVRVSRSGEVRSIFDKKLNRELLSAPIAFEIYPDTSTVWPAWEYNFEDLKKRPKQLPREAEIEVIDRRPVYVALKITKKYQESVFETTVTLAEGASALRFDNRVRWYERASNLFVRFPLTAASDTAVFDADPGAVKGGITDSYPYFMHNVHEWADQQDESGSFGVLIANDCKYGMTKQDRNTLSLALIHTPKGSYQPASGQDFQDFGLNLFSYTIQGYGTARGEALRGAEALNLPVSCVKAETHKGARKSLSFLELEGSGAQLTACKEEEKGSLLILRVKETEGKAQRGLRIKLPLNRVKKVYACDGYERISREMQWDETGFRFDLDAFAVASFALEVEKTLCRGTRDIRIPLPVNEKIFTRRGEKLAAARCALPAELFAETVSANGVSYRLSRGEKDVLKAAGQRITLPEPRKYLRILAAARSDRKPFSFLVGKNTVTFPVAPLNCPVGSIESSVAGTANAVTKDAVAVCYTHTHDENGGDRLYDFAYLFEYEIPLEGETELTLPDDGELLLFAATATDKARRPMSGEVYDDYGEDDQRSLHRLTVVGCDGSGVYPEGALVRIFAPTLTDDALFMGFEKSDDIVSIEENLAVVRVGQKNLTVKARYKKLGKDLARGKRCRANHEMSRQESAEHALDGNSDTKWCGTRDENGVCTLVVDLGRPEEISSYLIVHAGSRESRLWNTVDFEILTKVREAEKWSPADSVSDNRENLTNRSFPPRRARYVMLRITQPCRDGDSHARIYGFEVFR